MRQGTNFTAVARAKWRLRPAPHGEDDGTTSCAPNRDTRHCASSVAHRDSMRPPSPGCKAMRFLSPCETQTVPEPTY